MLLLAFCNSLESFDLGFDIYHEDFVLENSKRYIILKAILKSTGLKSFSSILLLISIPGCY